MSVLLLADTIRGACAFTGFPSMIISVGFQVAIINLAQGFPFV
jgi:hypothetical protein